MWPNLALYTSLTEWHFMLHKGNPSHEEVLSLGYCWTENLSKQSFKGRAACYWLASEPSMHSPTYEDKSVYGQAPVKHNMAVLKHIWYRKLVSNVEKWQENFLPRYASQIILVARIWFTPLYGLFAIKPELV